MKYDIAVIGGGPAGMMAAGRAGELGARVVLIEKNQDLGRKILSTGGGRCNFTNVKYDNRELAAQFGSGGKFLLSAFSHFSPKDVMEFFASGGVKAKVEDNGRVLPESDRATDILNALLKYLKRGRVEIISGVSVKNLAIEGKRITAAVLSSGEEIIADKFLIAVGGKSYPSLGSSGDGYNWLRKLGHHISPPVPGLAPLLVKEPRIKNLEGASLKNVKISAADGGKKIAEASGDLIFTFNGISGPAVLDLSGAVARHGGKDIVLTIDLYPEASEKKLAEKLQQIFEANGLKTIRNTISTMLPAKIVADILFLAKINSEKKSSLVSKIEKTALVALLKKYEWRYRAVAGFDYAMITVGGVTPKEIDQKTMKSKVVDNLYLAGEIIDLQGPTGGYNLQLCWGTGYLAGEAMAQAK